SGRDRNRARRGLPPGDQAGVTPHRRSGFSRRLAMWIALAFLASLAVIAAVVYPMIFVAERNEGDSPPVAASEARDKVLFVLAVAAPFGIAIAVGGAIALSRRALRPVNAVIATTTAISVDRLDRRVPVPKADDELRDAVLAVNALLGRLEGGFDAQRRFAA